MSIELDDLETRLREMYAAIAETTVVDDPVMDTVPATRPEPPTRRRVALLVAAAVVVVAAFGWVVSRRGDAQPAGPMDGRPFAIPMYMPEGFGLDGTAVADTGDIGGPGSGVEPRARGFSTRLKFDGPNGQIIWIVSYAVDGLTATPTAEAVRLDDGTVAQWSDGPGAQQLAWTLPTGQAVTVSGTEVSQARLIAVASSLWYVDRATWDRVTAKAGYVSGTLQTWRIPGDGTSTDLMVTGSLRRTFPPYGLRLQTASTGMGYQARTESCAAWASSEGADDKDVVYMVPNTATAVRATGPNGEVVEAPVAMAPGLPLFRWAAISFPDATERWLNATDHSKGCTAVIP